MTFFNSVIDILRTNPLITLRIVIAISLAPVILGTVRKAAVIVRDLLNVTISNSLPLYGYLFNEEAGIDNLTEIRSTLLIS